ncbi:hypothetical protein L6452_27277 [Arctium lappa]|uniref:Uncharacterized protein n=1 Tax=Arctium lappa TaxID=4217 RepID=A0ACB9A0F4_ARCLA|nr:hypothetical protein L6452_27277 [Arctium lappa]
MIDSLSLGETLTCDNKFGDSSRKSSQSVTHHLTAFRKGKFVTISDTMNWKKLKPKSKRSKLVQSAINSTSSSFPFSTTGLVPRLIRQDFNRCFLPMSSILTYAKSFISLVNFGGMRHYVRLI